MARSAELSEELLADDYRCSETGVQRVADEGDELLLGEYVAPDGHGSVLRTVGDDLVGGFGVGR